MIGRADGNRAADTGREYFETPPDGDDVQGTNNDAEIQQNAEQNVTFSRNDALLLIGALGVVAGVILSVFVPVAGTLILHGAMMASSGGIELSKVRLNSQEYATRDKPTPPPGEDSDEDAQDDEDIGAVRRTPGLRPEDAAEHVDDRDDDEM
jgi:hypothetical protein